VNTDTDSHQHVLWSFDRFSIVILKQIGSFQRSKPKVIIVKISLVDKSRLYLIYVSFYNVKDIFGKQRSLSPLLVLEVFELFRHF
jgi:hypothetical protein